MSEMKIQVKYTPTEWVKGVEDWGFWYCQHPSQHIESITNDYMTLNGASQNESEVVVCDSCDAWHDDLGGWNE